MKFLVNHFPKTEVWAEMLYLVGGIVLLFAAAQIDIPLKPVPVTLQTVAVMLIGLTYSPRRALQAHLGWLGLAGLGFPVLTGFKGGIMSFVGPTGGYLAGFVVASFLMATLKERFSLNSWKSDALLTLLGTVILYTLGVAWLTYLMGWPNSLYLGLLPFLLPGLVKGGLLCTALQIVRRTRRG